MLSYISWYRKSRVGLRNCVSNKLSGDVQAAGPWTTLERQGECTSRRQIFTVQSAAHLETHHCLPVHSGFSPKWQPEPSEYRFLIPHFNYEASTVKPPYSGILYLQIRLLAKISFQPQKTNDPAFSVTHGHTHAQNRRKPDSPAVHNHS